ncbi:MAG: hypothetical protein J0H34_22370 [Rhizobiales bacterium]|nr:hypothetical protein [Hyphomicrobiales bacterium]
MRLLIVIALFLGAIPAQAAEPYFCKDFSKDFETFAESNSQKIDSWPPQFLRTSGFILGAYYAHQGDPFDGDSSGMAEFEKKVLAECKRSPASRVSLLTLDLLRHASRDPKLTGHSDFPGLRLSVASLKQSLPGLAKVVFEVSNDGAELISASIRCSLYDIDQNPLGSAGGFANMVPPKGSVIGEAIGDVREAKAADCRIIDYHASNPN